MPSCSINCATSWNRSGCRGAKIINARGWLSRTFSKARNSKPSSPSTVLPQTITGSALACSRADRRLSTIGGGAATATSNFRFPLTCTRSIGAPISRKRFASSSVCARNRSMFRRILLRIRRRRRYPGHERSEMRAFTTATCAPLACARRKKFGQNSVSARTTSRG